MMGGEERPSAPWWERGFAIGALLLMTGALVPHLRGWTTADANLDAVQGDPLMQAVWFGVYLVTLGLLGRHWRHARAAISRNLPLWALVGLALLSVIWSGAPDVTLRRGVALMGTTCFGLYLAARYSLGEQLRLLATTLGLAVALSLLWVVGFPATGVAADGMWRGIFINKNVLGRVMAMTAVVLVLAPLRGGATGWLGWVGIACAVGLLVQSDSRTSLLVLTVCLAVVLARSIGRWQPALLAPTILAGTSAGLLGLLWGLDHAEMVIGALGRDTTLTGRTELWWLVQEMILRRPWLGYGYSAFWLELRGPSAVIWQQLAWRPPHSHNAFADLLLDLGMVGGAVFLVGFAAAGRRAFGTLRASPSRVAAWPLVFLVFMLLYNLVESAILKGNNYVWVLYVAVSLSTGRLMAGAAAEDAATRLPSPIAPQPMRQAASPAGQSGQSATPADDHGGRAEIVSPRQTAGVWTPE